MRYHDWPERLFAVVRKAQGSIFQWGRNDCALFACDCAQAMTGVDRAESFRGKYKTEKGARQALRKIENVKNLPQLADKYLGERIELSHAGRGDVVSLKFGGREVLGVITGDYAVFVAPEGVETVPVEDCICAWRVE